MSKFSAFYNVFKLKVKVRTLRLNTIDSQTDLRKLNLGTSK